MAWTSLAEHIDNLPLIVAGPIVRRAEPRLVTVWLALKEARDVTLRIYECTPAGQLEQRMEGTRATIRLGDNLHLVAVTIQISGDEPGLSWGQLYYYDLFFAPTGLDTSEPIGHLATRGILSTDPAEEDPLQSLIYPGHPLPGFMLPAAGVSDLRIVHGSCRKPHGVGKEMLSALDTIIATANNEPDGLARRPQQLFMTGDQIYADDVAVPLLFALMDAAQVLFAGNQAELLPEVNVPVSQLLPTRRKEIVHNQARLTSSKVDNHLLSLAEYAAMYLFTWSDVLWPDDLPTAEELWAIYPELQPPKDKRDKVRSSYADVTERLQDFRTRLPAVRRALANIATYMICDDHDITDDLFLDGAWCQQVLCNLLGRRIMRNGLLAYALFQAWGNIPTQFEESSTLLEAIDGWRGDDEDPRVALIEEAIGLPVSFAGTGSLQHAKQALRWHYTYVGPNYQLIAMDTRTERHYRAPTDFPGLLSTQAMYNQLMMNRSEAAEVTIILSAAPVLGIDFVESIQFWSRWQIKDNYSFDREAWALEWGTFQELLQTISSMRRVVFLSGDVHYAFGSSLEYWNRHTGETARLVNYTSSPFCNEGAGSQISVLALGYPRLLHLLRHGKEAALDFFIWDVVGDDHHTLNYLLTLIRKRSYRFWWAIPRLIATRRAAHEIVLPASGWLKGAFDILPPDKSYRLRYLSNTLVRTDEREHRPHANLSRLILKPLRTALQGVTLLQSRTEVARRRLQRTTDRLDGKAPTLLQHPTNRLLGRAIGGTEFIERRLDRPRQNLVDALLHSETWLSRWKAGSLIVGYNNIGEISFEWSEDKKEVKQKLWWHQPDAPEQLQSTEYSETLILPGLEDEPPLP